MTPRKTSTSSKSRLTKVPVQAYLEPEQVAELKALSERTRVPQQVYIRDGIEYILKWHRESADNPPRRVHVARRTRVQR